MSKSKVRKIAADSSDDDIEYIDPRTGKDYHRKGCIITKERTTLPLLGASPAMGLNLPSKVDLRRYLGRPMHQGSTNSCVAFALAGACEFSVNKRFGSPTQVSPLFIYYNGRRISSPNDKYLSDEGVDIDSAIESLEAYGWCQEMMYPFKRANLNRSPPGECYEEAKPYRIAGAGKVEQTLYSMKACLADEKPFTFALDTFQSFDFAEFNGGLVRMPSQSECRRASHGCHAMLAVGYNDEHRRFTVRNSWGHRWGDGGYCYIPYQYMTNPELCRVLRSIDIDLKDARPQPEAHKAIANLDTNLSFPQPGPPNNVFGPRPRPYPRPMPPGPVHPRHWPPGPVHPRPMPPGPVHPRHLRPPFPPAPFPHHHNPPWIRHPSNGISPYEDRRKLQHGQQLNPWMLALAQRQGGVGWLFGQQAPDEPELRPVLTDDDSAFILWIDEKNETNSLIEADLRKSGTMVIEFCEAFSMAEEFLVEYKEKIKSTALLLFQIICHGYYRDEDKSPLDILSLLDYLGLSYVPVLVYTRDKIDLENHLQQDRKALSHKDWRKRLFITDHGLELFNQVKKNFESSDSYPEFS